MNDSDALAVLRGEVLRWNRSFSLVSRQNPEERTDALINECVAAGEKILALLGDSPLSACVRYIDLGTGGGFPGLVWHQLFSGTRSTGFSSLVSLLVEPRDKRAWFLQQTAKKMNLSGVSVAQMRWGARVVDEEAGPGFTVVSMKALAMTDEDVLGGLTHSYPGCSGPCLIVRFISHEDVVNKTDEMLAGLFGAPVDSLSWGVSSEYCTLSIIGNSQESGLLLSWCP